MRRDQGIVDITKNTSERTCFCALSLCAVAHPGPGFVGKIGILCVGLWVPGQQNSVKHPSGTPI